MTFTGLAPLFIFILWSFFGEVSRLCSLSLLLILQLLNSLYYSNFVLI